MADPLSVLCPRCGVWPGQRCLTPTGRVRRDYIHTGRRFFAETGRIRQEAKEGRTVIQPGDGDPRHGTLNGYVNLSCGWSPDKPRNSCDPCKAANRVEHLTYMHGKSERLERHAARERARTRRRQEVNA